MKRSAERVQFLSDVMTTAVEGGINYWAAVSEYRWDLDKYTPEQVGVTVYDQEDDDWPEEGRRVDLDVIARGIGVLKKAGGCGDPDYWKQFLLADRTNGEDGDYDAGMADCILQAGLLGEVVYG